MDQIINKVTNTLSERKQIVTKINIIKENINKNNDELQEQYKYLQNENDKFEAEITRLRNLVIYNNKIMDKDYLTQDESSNIIQDNSISTGDQIDNINDRIFKTIKNKFVAADILIVNIGSIDYKVRILVVRDQLPCKYYFCMEDLDDMLQCKDTSKHEISIRYIDKDSRIELFNILYLLNPICDYVQLYRKYDRALLGLVFLPESDLYYLLEKSSNPNKENIIEFFCNYVLYEKYM